MCAYLVKFRPHERIHLTSIGRRHAQIERDGVMPMGTLCIAGWKHVEQGPQGVCEGLGSILGYLVAQEDAHTVSVLSAGLMLDTLDLQSSTHQI